MNKQEKTFADEYVFITFNSDETDGISNAIKAAKVAQYTLPCGKPQQESFVKSLLNKDEVASYLNSEFTAFKEKMNPSQRRNLWEVIKNMNISATCEWSNFGCIDAR